MNDIDSIDGVFEYLKFFDVDLDNDSSNVLEVMVYVVYKYLFRLGE